MKVTFWHSDKPRERILADAWKAGVLAHGDTCELRSLLPEPVAADCDVAVMFGVKSRALYRAHWDAGAHIVYVDKGYTRHAATGPVKIWEYWRVAVDAHQPTERLMDIPCTSARWDALALELRPWRKGGSSIVLAGSSQKYHDFYGIKDPTRWSQKVIESIRFYDDARPIIYRPKPSWRDAVPIAGSEFSPASQTIEEVLAGAAVLVTHGSNAVFEAALAGVPSIVLGDAVTRHLSSTDVADILEPRLASMPERLQWAHNLAHWQYTMPEIAAGTAWAWLRPQIYGRPQ